MFKNSKIGHVFEYGATPSGDMLKRMAPVDSAHEIGLATLLIDVLTVDEGVSGWRLKNRQIGHVVHCTSPTRPRTSKRTTVLKSARQIGVSTISKDVLTVHEGVCGWMFKNSKIGHVFCHISTTRARTSNQTTPSDSAHRIGQSTLLNDALTVDEGVCGWRFKNREIWDVFNYCARMDRDMNRWMAPFDSGHQIRLEIIFNGILTALGSCCSHGDGCGNILGGVF